jgi:CheY-like chemotaxis protein
MAAAESSGPGRTHAILVVEDSYMVALDLCHKLERLGHTIIGPAPTPEAALALLEAQSPTVALLDETLDEESVFPVAEALQRRRIPFAIISGHVRSPSGEELLRTAPRLHKPPLARHLQAVLEDLTG